MTRWFEWREAPEAEYAVIGDPVSHSLSPVMQEAGLRAMGFSHRYVAIRVPLEEFEAALERLAELGIRGVNATVPLKEAAFGWAKLGPDSRFGALNTLDLVRREGINTDAPGFMQTLEAAKVAPGVALVLGAGGTARTLARALLESGWRVRVANRGRARLEDLASVVPGIEPLGSPDPSEAGLVLNTTSAALSGMAPELAWDAVGSEALVYDVSYGEGLTPFLAEAVRRGLRTMDGRALLVAQGALSLEWWTGASAPREAMWKAISQI